MVGMNFDQRTRCKLDCEAIMGRLRQSEPAPDQIRRRIGRVGANAHRRKSNSPAGIHDAGLESETTAICSPEREVD